MAHGATSGRVSEAFVVSRTFVDGAKAVRDGRAIDGYDKVDDETAREMSWGLVNLEVDRAWQTWASTLGAGVRVAVLDTGINHDHPAFHEYDERGQRTGSVIEWSADFTRDDKTLAFHLNRPRDQCLDEAGRLDKHAEDDEGHGTHCAGIIAARELPTVGYNRPPVPMRGVARKAKLLVGKVLRKDGKGKSSWLAEGIRWAIQQRADIISLSLTSPEPSSDVYFAIHQALYMGRFVICAAGNEGSLQANGIGYPGRYGGVITVAAHDRHGKPTGFSSTGGELDFIGPGENVWSTYLKGKYKSFSGTSMATPFVAGLSALILSKHRQPPHRLTPEKVRKAAQAAFDSVLGGNRDIATAAEDAGEGIVTMARNFVQHILPDDEAKLFERRLGPPSNGTPLLNNEDLKEHLMRMATHAGWHDPATGYGLLRPLEYFLERL